MGGHGKQTEESDNWEQIPCGLVSVSGRFKFDVVWEGATTGRGGRCTWG